MTKYSVSEIAEIVKADWLRKGEQADISHLLTDSRKLIYPANTIFVSIITKNRDGHLFIPELYKKGVRTFLISKKIDTESFSAANFLFVKDTLLAFQTLAEFHRRRFQIPVIGITGSNGKTIVKEWLYQLLERNYRIVRSPKSYNSQIGVPLSVWQMDSQDTLGIFEAGISQPGEMIRLEKIIRPSIGIFTNIGDAHNEGFINILQKIREKLILFSGTNLLIYCKDYPDLHDCILQFQEQRNRDEKISKGHLKLLTWSKMTEADLRIKSTVIEESVDINGKRIKDTLISAVYHGIEMTIRIPFTDQGSIENAIHCWCLMLQLNIPDDDIKERMLQLAPIAMRLEMRQAIHDCSIINDSYNSDLASISIALDFLSQQNQHSKKTLILSDIFQSSKDESNLYEQVAGLLEQKGITRLIGIGKNISREKDIFKKNPKLLTSFYADTDDFINHFLSTASSDHELTFHQETILLKGARVFEFERISNLLEQKTHQTILEINLNALANNLKVYRSLLKPQVKMMAMVKAFSYGSGSYEIANLLQFQGVDYLAVAYADEGIELRKRGISLPIMVMNPEPGAFHSIIQWKIEPEIYSLRLLNLFHEEILSLRKTDYPVHIKLDTGMHRLGFSPEDIPHLMRTLLQEETLKVVSVFSHLAASDDPAQSGFTLKQGELFEKMSSDILKELPYPVIRHLANSAAITMYPQLQYDMVRLGIGMYGIDHTNHLQNQLEVVTTLKTTISQIRTVKAGDTIGYGGHLKLESDKIIATIPIGYADGYQRILGNGKGELSIHGKLAPVIGNVCMDMLMVDITEIPDAKEGDQVIVFGKDPAIQEIARRANTIPYEMMTGISQRVKRIYVQE